MKRLDKITIRSQGNALVYKSLGHRPRFAKKDSQAEGLHYSDLTISSKQGVVKITKLYGDPITW